jgi:hypothetical protein
MSKRIALVTTTLMLAMGAAGAASAAANKQAPAAHPRSQASLQCSADADAKGLHGKERVAFRRDCLRRAYHNAMPVRHYPPPPAATTPKQGYRPDDKS